MWQLGRLSLNSRLLVSSDAFTDVESLSNAHQNCSPDIAIAPVRPTHPEFGALDDVWNKIRTTELHIIPSTSGCFTPEDAITTAQFAAQRLETPWLVLQITGCAKTLFPDAEGTIEGARELVRSGFSVIPVCTDDPVLCQRMADIGCKAIMPLVSPTPHRCGFENIERIRLIRQAVNIPLILAGAMQTASDVVIALELGSETREVQVRRVGKLLHAGNDEKREHCTHE